MDFYILGGCYTRFDGIHRQIQLPSTIYRISMSSNETNNKTIANINLIVEEDKWAFASSIDTALLSAENEAQILDEQIKESLATIENLTPDCDKLDYALSASCGMLCGLLDIFLVGGPGDSPFGNVTDQWFKDRTKAFAWQDKKIRQFAKKVGWTDSKISVISDPIKYLEKTYKVPYDQTGLGDAGKDVFGLNATNHHFKSLGHNPTLMGLFFSILDQFGYDYKNTSHFVTDGMLISLTIADNKFELRGKTVPSKIFCGFVNWFGHLMSDVSGSSSSKGRGMGIPSPIWCWTNDVIVIKNSLGITPNNFDKSVNELACRMFEEGYDTRFQTAQAIPVFVNEMIVRFIYAVRRTIKYFKNTSIEEYDFKELWNQCEPFSNASVKRMLTVAHGAFCALDVVDASIRGAVAGGGSFNVVEFCMRLNIVGIGRFSISLYGEAARAVKCMQVNEDAYLLVRKKTIVDDYIEGLKNLSAIYDDSYYLSFVDDLQNSDMYITAFAKTAELAQLRGVQPEIILETKDDIDSYFGGKK